MTDDPIFLSTNPANTDAQEKASAAINFGQ
jgi:hypothetical protein